MRIKGGGLIGRLIVCRRGFRHVRHVRPNRSPTKRGKGPTGQRMSDNSATFSSLWEPVYGVLQHSKVHLVCHDIFWPM